ncbi:CheW protein [Hyella patelloides LEGE 07179]|uniref:CheW protein n=1 Tax=Hyella patelloides LEGE 07179 TaxID=945734 RepID=A0A563W4H4_9CYAN|nr:chemotaxis protein CheW [Hyella patelloides]VEP18588.1 CheW protein [Hyella patelloides LEGE 07179]
MDTILPVEEVDSRPTSIQKPYLRLELGQNIAAALPMKNAQEVLSLKRDRVTPMPNMPDCVFGLLNQRSRIFWVVDLSQLLEMPPIDRSLQEYNLAIIRTQETALGVVVPVIKGVIRFSVEDIQSPVGNVAPGLVPYLQGCVLEASNVLLVLDAEAIINSPLLQS